MSDPARAAARQAFLQLREPLRVLAGGDPERAGRHARAVVVALLCVQAWEQTSGEELWPRPTGRAAPLAEALAPSRARGLTPLLEDVPEDAPLPLEESRALLRQVDATPLARIHQDLLGQELGSDRSARRRQGSYYTPPALCDALSELLLSPLLQRRSGPADALLDLRLLDPAAGAGDLLLALLRRLEAEWTTRGASLDASVRRRLAGCLVAADADPCAVVLARLAVQRWAHEPGRAPLPLPWLMHGDALLEVLPAELAAPLAEDRAYRSALGGPGEAAAGAALDAAMRVRATPLDQTASRLHGHAVRAIHWRALLPAGVDGVIGNPPYHRELGGRELFLAVRRSRLGEHARSKGDLWFFFTHLALELLRPGGQHAFVVPAYWLKATGAGPRALREALRARCRWRALLDLRELDVFGAGVAGRHVAFALERADTSDASDADEPVAVHRAAPGTPLEQVTASVQRRDTVGGATRHEVSPSSIYGRKGEVLLDLALSHAERRLLARLQGGQLPAGWELSEGITANPERVTGRALASLVSEGHDLAARGVQVGEPVFVVPHEWPREQPLTDRERSQHLLPWLRACDVQRLEARPPGEAPWLIYTTPANVRDAACIPHLAGHLARVREVLERRRETRRGSRAWFHLHWPRSAELFRGERVLIPRMTRWPAAAAIHEPCATGESVFTLIPQQRSWSPLVVTLLNALPFSAGILLTTKRRGKGIDIPRAALAACPWPSEGQLRAALTELDDPDLDARLDRALTGAWGGSPLALAAAASRRLTERHSLALRGHEAPWWRHPHTQVAALGRVIDEGVCRLLDLPYEPLKELVERHQKNTPKN